VTRPAGACTSSRAGAAPSYSRTYLLSSCQHQTVASLATTLVLARDDPSTPADEGRTFGFVSGLGGRSIRPQLLTGPWWASIYTSTQGANYGALFGVFNYQGDPGLAYFYFKDISGHITDQFFVRSAMAPNTTTTTTTIPAVCGDVNGDGIVNVDDALLVAQFDLGLRQCGQGAFTHPELCDVNHDNACNIGDALRMAQCDVGLISCTFTCRPFQCP